jgi:hypothetical protein
MNAILIIITVSIMCFNVDQSVPIFAKKLSGEIDPTAQKLSQFCKNIPASSLFIRTELFFGLGKSDGTEVTNSEFQQFLTREVTPKFPDGLTLLSGRGQFKNTNATLVKEPANLLILVYRSD